MMKQEVLWENRFEVANVLAKDKSEILRRNGHNKEGKMRWFWG